MSSPLAIAAVTDVMKKLLIDRLKVSTSEVRGILADVTTMPPDKIDISSDEENNLNLYMYMVSSNQGWQNRDFPSHKGSGDRISNPFLALDLYYVLSAYGDSASLAPEKLLAYGMLTFHEYPVFSEALLNEYLTEASLISSELAKQIELIKITPDVLSTEEMSRLWTSFGAKYRQSAYYKVSVLLIESKKPTRVALPVEKPLIYVHTYKKPLINIISSKADNTAPIIDNQKILSTYQLVIKGQQLKGEGKTVVLIDGVKQPDNQIKEIGNSQVILSLPTTIKSGLHTIQISHQVKMGRPEEFREGFSSNVAALILSPLVETVSEENVQINGGTTQKAVRFKITPLPENTQSVFLLLKELGTTNPREYRFEKDFSQTLNPTSPAGTVTIPISGVASGKYLVRVRVDKAESKIANDYQSPFVDIT